MITSQRSHLELSTPSGQEAEPFDANQLTRIGYSGCMVALAWAVVACLLLFINGGLVLALLLEFEAEFDGTWLRDERVAQLLVLIGPVVLLVMQWWLIDKLRSYFPIRR